MNCFGISESILEPEPPPTMIAKYFTAKYMKTHSESKSVLI
jgi:hypothetical protein